MAQWPSAAQHDQDRAMWYRVRVFPRASSKPRSTTGFVTTNAALLRSAALCQVYDSIFLDLPMARVKFDAKTEYAYLENFKILSNSFRKHQIERPIPVKELIKCKMQDNLEFLQWTKRYWDQYYPGGDYDALSRRKGAGAGAAPAMPPSSRTSGAGIAASTRKPALGVGTAPRTSSRGNASTGGSAMLQAKNAELTETVQGLERERDFYFSKLRDIELLIQQAMEADPSLEEEDSSLLKQIQTILYSTEVCVHGSGEETQKR